jgi:hypothetical protein
MSHTPWEVVDDQIIEDERGSVAIVWAPEYVHLIAAAPALLYASNELIKWLDNAPDRAKSFSDDVEPLIRAAIAKATESK